MPEESFQKIQEFLSQVIAGHKRVRRREAELLIFLGVASVLLLAPGAVVLQPHFGYAAIMYLLTSGLVFLSVLARAIWLIKKPPTPENVAIEIEMERKNLGNNLISSLQLFPTRNALHDDDPTSPVLIDALVLETAGQVGKLSPSSFVSDLGIRRLRGLAAAIGGTAFAIGVLWPGIYSRAGYLAANALELMPSRITHLYLSASAKRILAGSDVVFKVRAEGRSSGSVDLEFTQIGRAPNKDVSSRIPMEQIDEHHFRLKWKGGTRGVQVVAKTGRFRSPPVDLQVVPPPRIKVIETIYFPPDYTPLGPKRQVGKGHIRAFLGSSVLVRVKPTKSVSEALLHLSDGWRIALKAGKESFLEGLLLVGNPGSYQVRLKDLDGFSDPAPTRYRIDIIPDTPPVVRVTEPGKDITLEAEGTLRMRYRVSDDLGLRNVNLKVRVGNGRPRLIRLWERESAQKVVEGNYIIDLRSFSLNPGSSLVYSVVAEDTDTISGPKQGLSPVYRIRIRDREAVIASLDTKLNEISSKLLDLLGDYLEKEVVPTEFKKSKKATKPTDENYEVQSPKEKKGLFDKALEIMKKVKSARDILRPGNPREALASMDLTTLSGRIREVMRRYLFPMQEGQMPLDPARRGQKKVKKRRLAQREEATESIERLASMSEDMLRNLRIDRAGKTAAELIRGQRILARLLEKMRRSNEVDENTMRRVEMELARLREKFARFMDRLASLAQRMPSEFMNQRGMRNAQMQNMMSAFDKIHRLMRKGDIRSALEMLRQLMNQIQQLHNAMRGVRRNQMNAQRGGRPMQSRQTELNKIVKEQQSVLNETIEVFNEIVRRTQKEWPQSLKKFTRYLKAELVVSKKLAKRIRIAECVPNTDLLNEKNPSFRYEASKKVLGEFSGFGVSGVPRVKMPKKEWNRLVAKKRDEIHLAHREALNEFEGAINQGSWRGVPGLIQRLGLSIQSDPCIGKKEKKMATARWKKAQNRLEGHLRKSEKSSPYNERRKLRKLQMRQIALEKRLTGFWRRLRRLMQLYPFLDPKPIRRIEDAKKAMANAESALGMRRSSKAILHEERVLELLGQAQNQLKLSMQKMAQRGRFGMGTSQSLGVYQSPRRSWWAQNPTLPGGLAPSHGYRKQGEDAREGIDFSEVQIPDGDQYLVPEKFREEVMEALREGLPSSLRSEIENYYERLTR